jgi:hypothetical protein
MSTQDSIERIVAVIQPETALEEALVTDPEWQAGVLWGQPRHGHPEGKVLYHIGHVLKNVEWLTKQLQLSKEDRAQLRLITLLHDTFKHQVDETKPKTGSNHHAARAATFAQKYSLDESVLKIIHWHDEAYNSWLKGARKGKWDKAEERLQKLIEVLGEDLQLYYWFFYCDNNTEGKQSHSLTWFESNVRDQIKVIKVQSIE